MPTRVPGCVYCAPWEAIEATEVLAWALGPGGADRTQRTARGERAEGDARTGPAALRAVLENESFRQVESYGSDGRAEGARGRGRSQGGAAIKGAKVRGCAAGRIIAAQRCALFWSLNQKGIESLLAAVALRRAMGGSQSQAWPAASGW